MNVRDRDWHAADGLAGLVFGVCGEESAAEIVGKVLTRRGASLVGSGVDIPDAWALASRVTGELLAPSVRGGVLPAVEIAFRIARGPVVAFAGCESARRSADLCARMLQASGLGTCPCAGFNGSSAPASVLLAAEHARQGDILVIGVECSDLEFVMGFRPRVAVVLGSAASVSVRAADDRSLAEILCRMVEWQGRPDLAIFSNGFAESHPGLLLGEGRHYRACVEHPVESGAYLDRGKLRVVGRTDASEGALPDLKIDAPQGDLADVRTVECVMAAVLAALEMGASPEAIERTLRLRSAHRGRHFFESSPAAAR